jgi:dUTP pyrophosphatase
MLINLLKLSLMKRVFNMQEVNFSFVNKNLSKEQQEIITPKRQSHLASGFDLVSAHEEDVVIKPMARVLVSTGISIGLNEGYEAQIRARSGLALKHGLIIVNAPGTIDADYRGEIKVIIANLSEEAFSISFGMRIAQLVIAPVCLAQLKLVEILDEQARGSQGFGSTGL